MVKARKQLFSKGFVISEDELRRLNLLLSQLDLLNRWLASDERSQIILIRDELLAFDKQTETTK